MDTAFEKGDGYFPSTETEAKEWLLKVLKRFPKKVGDNVMDKWRLIGPLELAEKLDQKMLKLEYNLELVDRANFSFKRDYFGQLNKNGQFHGIGRAVWHDKNLYEGMFKDGFANGYGRQIYPNGSIYEGEWCDAVWHGHGCYIRPDGSISEGEFENGTFLG